MSKEPEEAQVFMVEHLAHEWNATSSMMRKTRLHFEVGGFLRGIRSCVGESVSVRKLEGRWTALTGEPPYFSATRENES